MKNYKHASKNVNAMKLAAVASAAVMLAPVAMSSVSSFAMGSVTNGKTGSDKQVTQYPEYKVLSVDQAQNAGTNGQIGSPLVGYNVADVQKSLDAVAAIPTTWTSDTNFEDQFNTLAGPGSDAAKLGAKTQTVYSSLTDATNSALAQMNFDNQNVAYGQIKSMKSKLDAINNEAAAAYQTLSTAASQADQYAKTYKADPSNDTKYGDMKSAADTYSKDADAYKAAVAKYSSFISAVNDFETTWARQTNNGAVTEAAKEAALAISKMPEGPAKDAATSAFLKDQGDYHLVTLNNWAGDDAKGKSNAKLMDDAAKTAVAALKKIANDNYAGDTSKFMGTVHVNYNKNYGIQIWTKDGQRVVYNSVDAAAAGKKIGDAKKLAGQSNWKVFNDKYTANGTTYYNLGGDQYIDAAYVTFTPAK